MGKKVRLIQRSDQSLSILEEQKVFRLETNAPALIAKIDREMRECYRQEKEAAHTAIAAVVEQLMNERGIALAVQQEEQQQVGARQGKAKKTVKGKAAVKGNKGGLSLAQLKFLRTGVWNAKVTEEGALDRSDCRRDWVIGTSEGVLEEVFSGKLQKELKGKMYLLPEDTFRQAMEAYNRNALQNLKGLEETDKGQLRAQFLHALSRIAIGGNPEERKAVGLNGDKNDLHLFQSLTDIINLQLPQVDALILNFFKARSENSVFFPLEGQLEQLLDLDTAYGGLVRNEKDLQAMGDILRMARRKASLDEDLNLKFYGKEVYESKAIQLLLLKDEITEKEWTELKQQKAGAEKVLRKMVDAQFSSLAADRVMEGLLQFLGEKLFFADYFTLRDLSERYLRGISLTNGPAALLEKDYRAAYSGMEKRAFSALLTPYVAAFLKNDQGSWKSDQADGRKKRMAQRLKDVTAAEIVLEEVTEHVTLSRAGWQKLVRHFGHLLAGVWCRMRLGTDEEIKGAKEELRNNLKQSIQEIAAKDAKQAMLLGRDDFISGEKEPVPEKKVSPLRKEDYSFAGIFRGEACLESEPVRGVVTDRNLREYLSGKLHTIIITNRDLKERFPFLREIRNLGQLDTLTFSQFESLCAYFRENLSGPEVAESVRKLVTGDAELLAKETVLLEVIKRPLTREEIEGLMAKEVQRRLDTLELHKKRLQIAIGKPAQQRDGRMRFRFEDLPEEDKGLFGRKKWLSDRLSRFEQANETWKKLNALPPEAAEQVKRWGALILGAFERDGREHADRLLDELAEVLSSDKRVKSVFEEDNDLSRTYQSDQLTLMDDIREAFRTTVGKVDLVFDEEDQVQNARNKKQDKRALKVRSFLREIFLSGAQDILFAHGSEDQKILFMEKGKVRPESYTDELMKLAVRTNARIGRLDRDMARYKSQPAMQRILREKMLPIYLGIEQNSYERSLV
ncbi:MAG: hypothetical protein IKN20_03315, partial [Firmicutes bacterium]|nr:hypothetical protein [Bacillota bacterium]